MCDKVTEPTQRYFCANYDNSDTEDSYYNIIEVTTAQIHIMTLLPYCKSETLVQYKPDRTAYVPALGNHGTNQDADPLTLGHWH